MSGAEKEMKAKARASAVQDAKSVCELLDSRRGMLSDDKNELMIARDARELSKTLASIAEVLRKKSRRTTQREEERLRNV